MKRIISWLKHQRPQQEAIAIEEKLRPSRLPGLDIWPARPLVSVLVAAWNEEAHIETFLRSFDRLDYPNKELVLVAGGDDETHRLAHNMTHQQFVLLEQQAGEGKFIALKKGLKKAKGDVIFLTDADCTLNSQSFKRMIYPLATGMEVAVTGPVRPLEHQSGEPFVRAQAVNLFRKMLLVPDLHVSFLIGANSALKRSLLEDYLGSSENQVIGEDYFLALSIRKSGRNIFYDHEGFIETHYPHSFRAYVRQKSRWHRGYLLLHYQFGDRRWIANILTSLQYQLLLIIPFLSTVLGYLGGLIWLLSWGIFFIPYVKAKILADKLGQTPKVSLPSLFQLMLADFAAWAICLPQALLSRWRHEW